MIKSSAPAELKTVNKKCQITKHQSVITQGSHHGEEGEVVHALPEPYVPGRTPLPTHPHQHPNKNHPDNMSAH